MSPLLTVAPDLRVPVVHMVTDFISNQSADCQEAKNLDNNKQTCSSAFLAAQLCAVVASAQDPA